MSIDQEINYQDFSFGKRKPERNRFNKGMSNVRWWTAQDDGQLCYSIMSQIANIINADKGRIESYNTYSRLYGTFTPTYWNGYQLANNGRPVNSQRDRLTYNIVQSCIDTLTSRVAQNKPKPMFLTNAGDSKLQRKAKKLDAFCYGLFYENDMYKLAPKIFRDSCVWGDGYIHPYAEGGRIRYERVMPYELLVDYLESHSGPEHAKSLFRIKNIDRTELAKMFPDKEAEIMVLSPTSQLVSAASKSVSDNVTVAEAWRLPVGTPGTSEYVPGRHAIVTDGIVFEDEEYEDDFFPFARVQYSPRLYGYYSQGMAEQLVPTQIEINRTLISIQRSLYLGGTHKIFVKNGSKVIKSHFDNMIGTILEYAGDTMPQYVVPQLVQPEIYAHLQNMKDSGYQLSGVSQLSAANQKPMGLDSGKALRAYDQNQDQRFQTVSQQYEQFFVELAKVSVSAAKKLYLNEGNFSVKVPGKRFIETIDWKDVDLDNDQFMLQIYPVSKLPQDPEGRLQTIQEMMQAGLIDPQTGRRLLDYPDLEAEENLANAAMDYTHKILDEMVEDGVYTAPEPYDNLQLMKKTALEYYSQGKLNGLREDRLELLRQFMDDVEALLMPPPPMPMMAGAGPVPGAPVGPVAAAGSAPMAEPMPTPQSDLVPNIA